MTDPIADMLTRIRNAQMAKKSEVVMPYSKLKFSLLTLLAKEGWLGTVEHLDPLKVRVTKSKFKQAKASEVSNRFASLRIKLKYDADKTTKISNLKRISKPGRRVYATKDKLPIVLNGYGMAIISTSQGLLTDKEARKKQVGGEIICEIY